jgi:hypothetical protein
MREDRVIELLRNVDPSASGDAEERAWELVRREFEARRTRPRLGSRRGLRVAVAAAAVALLALVVLTPAGAAVRDWIGEAFDTESEPDRQSLTELPGGGQLLVESPGGAWLVEADGSQRRLGDYGELTWSPRGLYAAATAGNQLVAVDPRGEVRWALNTAGPVSHPVWSPDGFRIAYRSGEQLRVVAGDGTGDRIVARRSADAQPAWRPGPGHRLAYVDRRGGAQVIDADGRKGFRFAVPRAGATGVGWSAGGKELLIYSRDYALVDLGGYGFTLEAPAGSRILSARIGRGGGRRVILTRANGRGAATRSELVVARPRGGELRQHVLFSAPGHLDGLDLSPDGRWVLVSWREANQWLFIRADRPGRVVSIGNIAEQFDPGRTPPRPGAQPAGWCCPP